MKIGPQYKIARRLGASVFEKTQSPKFARKEKAAPRRQSEYGAALIEKQRVRFSYRLSERQFSRYVKEAVAQKGGNAAGFLYARLEKRLDNVLYRLGFAKTRGLARQMVSHGHVHVNGRKVSIPSYLLKAGDSVSIRPGSKGSVLFSNLSEKLKETPPPPWLSYDEVEGAAKVLGEPVSQAGALPFNLQSVVEFYSR